MVMGSSVHHLILAQCKNTGKKSLSSQDPSEVGSTAVTILQMRKFLAEEN